mgnify:CR=1 FL=1
MKKWYLLVRVLVGVAFVAAGLSKFFAPESQEEFFRPYPSFFMPLIGILETAGGAALLAGFLVRWASLGLAVIMLGAVVTHFIIGLSPRIIPPLVLLALNLLLFSKAPKAGSPEHK